MNQPESVNYQEKLAARAKKFLGFFFGFLLLGVMAAYQGWATDDNKMIVDAILFFGVAFLTREVAILNSNLSDILGELTAQAEKASKSNDT